MNGLDMSMVPYEFSFYDYCVNLTNKDPAFAKRVDDATMRILYVKNELGLFENAYPFPEDLNKVGSEEAWNFTLEAARECYTSQKPRKCSSSTDQRQDLSCRTNRKPFEGSSRRMVLHMAG